MVVKKSVKQDLNVFVSGVSSEQFRNILKLSHWVRKHIILICVNEEDVESFKM